MIRYTHFRFFLLQDENRINGKQPRFVYTVLSFFIVRFHNGKYEWGNQVSFSFFLILKQKRGYRNMIRYTYIHFSFATSNKKNNRQTTFSVYAVLCFPVWCHSVGNTNKEPNHPLVVFRLAIIRKHNGICARLTCFGICVLYIKY